MVLRRSLQSAGMSMLLWMMPGFAYAQASDIHQTISWMVTWAIAAMNLGIWMVFTMLIQLLDTSMFLGNDMMGVLNEVWQLARDLVNIAFAFILIGAAVYTVVTTKREFIAEHLKKFVLAIVLVNFSWFIPRVIIDVGNIAAATVFDIPSMIKTDNVKCSYRSPTQIHLAGGPAAGSCDDEENTDPDHPQYICPCAAVIDAKYFLSTEAAAELKATDGWTPILGETMHVRLTELDTIEGAAPSTTILNGLIINHARLMGLATVPPSVKNTDTQALIMFMLKEAIVLILHAALFFPLAAMALAFAIRIPVLWLTIAFMPFMVLQFVVPDDYTGGYPKKIWDYFLKAAFLPAIVAIPLTIGFIMINAGQKAGLLSATSNIDLPLTGNISDFQELMWLVMVIGIIWVGVFSVLEKMEIMGKGAQLIKGAGEGLAKFAVKTPLSIPFVPLPGGGQTSLLNMGRSAKNMGQFDNPDDLFASLRRGGGKANTAKDAKKLADNPEQLKELNKSLEDLTVKLKNKNLSKEDREKAKDDFVIKNKDISIDRSNISGSIRSIVTEMHKVDGFDKTKTTPINISLSAFETAEKDVK